jgi:hypothetical protein
MKTLIDLSQAELDEFVGLALNHAGRIAEQRGVNLSVSLNGFCLRSRLTWALHAAIYEATAQEPEYERRSKPKHKAKPKAGPGLKRGRGRPPKAQGDPSRPIGMRRSEDSINGDQNK